VEDTGIGISPENQAKLFQPSTYSTKGTAGEYGTGLGLLVCKEYIEKWAAPLV
jgi:two-component system sensor histidine kinase/response regulator